MASKQWDAIVVGAGIGGLAAAHTLQRAGKSVLVLEAGDRPGGRIVRISHRGDSADAGAQGIHTNYEEMLRLVDEFGLKGELRPSEGPAEFLDRGGAPRLVASDLDMMRLLNPRGRADLIRYFTQYYVFRKRMPQFEIVRDVPAYDNVTAAEAFSWAGRDFHDFVLRPQTHAQCGVSPDHVNLYHLINLFRIKVATKAMGLTTGIVTLCERMAVQLGVRYRAEVVEVLTTAGRTDGVRLATGEAIAARHVIVACPINVAARIVPEEYGEAQSYLNQFTNTPMPLVFFFLDRPLPGPTMAFLGHAYQDVVFNMALNHTRKTPYMVPSGRAIISAWPAYPGGAQMIAKTDDEMIAQALKDVEPMIPGIAGMVDEARVQRHSWGFARYEPGAHRRLLEFKRYAAGLPGISFVSNDYDGVHMESSLRGGLRAAARASI